MGVVLDSDRPHLIGIDDDLTSTGITLYQLKVRATECAGATILCNVCIWCLVTSVGKALNGEVDQIMHPRGKHVVLNCVESA